MSNLKYRIKFQVTNLNKEELRDFKLNLVQSNYVLEFDSDVMPRLPNKKEVIRIGDRAFQMEDYEINFITENEQVYNVFNIFIFDVDKSEKQKQEQEQAKMFQKMRELSTYKTKKNDWYGYTDKFGNTDYDDFIKILNDVK
jgi:hypothetical protein